MSEPNGVGMRREDDRDRAGCLPGAFGLGRRGRKKNVDVHADQLGCRLLQLLDRLRPAKLNDEIRALDVTESAQARPDASTRSAEAAACSSRSRRGAPSQAASEQEKMFNHREM